MSGTPATTDKPPDPSTQWGPIRSVPEVGAQVAHYASVVVGAALLLYVSRDQWFYFDEWAFMLNPGAELWAGHGGHWSTIAIAAWMGIQALFGLDSYLPFLLLEIVVHLVTAHLLWRLMRRIGADVWIATALTAVFIVLGAGAENLLWAFQYGFIGAIACGLGAVLLTLAPTMGIGRQLSIAALLAFGAATSGTLLPFFVPVALIIWRAHGWRRLLITLGIPAVIYGAWFLLIAGPNSNEGLRAQGVQILYTPAFAAAMFVDGIGKMLPIAALGAVVVGALAVAVVVMLRRPLDLGAYAALAVLGAGLVFAALTAYSRWGTGIVSASSGRYVYFVFVTVAPLAALLLSRAARWAPAARFAVLVALGVVGVYNVGLLVEAANQEEAREGFVHEVVSAGVVMRDEYPGEVIDEASPEPQYEPVVNLAGLSTLVDDDHLSTVPYGREAWLTALVNVGVTLAETSSQTGTCTALAAGELLSPGTTLQTTAGATLTVAARDSDGTQGNARTLSIAPGTYTLTTVEDTPLMVSELEGAATTCVTATSEASS